MCVVPLGQTPCLVNGFALVSRAISVDCRWILVLGFAFLTSGTGAFAEKPSVDQVTPNAWIQRLGSESFLVRQQAKRWLIREGHNVAIQSAIRQSLDDDSLEVRLATRQILNHLAVAEFDRQLDRLITISIPADSIQLPGWELYRSKAGGDYPARCLFLQAAKDYPSILCWIEEVSKREVPLAGENSPASANSKECKERDHAVSLVFDPYRIESDNIALWSLLLCSDHPQMHHDIGNLTLRAALALTQPGLGPRPRSTAEAVVVSRLVSNWVESNPDVGTPRDRMMIALRYKCESLARRSFESVIADSKARPSDISMAMLCAAKMKHDGLRSELIDRLHDDRTAHTWKLIGTRHAKVVTQVRDIALALLLRHHGIDPRSIGFRDLTAHPLTIYRDHSLGFTTDALRLQAFEKAKSVLPTTPETTKWFVK